MDNTNFYALADHFEEALDRFAQFFLGPLFDLSWLEQEIKTVDSEHKKNDADLEAVLDRLAKQKVHFDKIVALGFLDTSDDGDRWIGLC